MGIVLCSFSRGHSPTDATLGGEVQAESYDLTSLKSQWINLVVTRESVKKKKGYFRKQRDIFHEPQNSVFKS